LDVIYRSGTPERRLLVPGTKKALSRWDVSLSDNALGVLLRG
jgi:hypothetical protein